MNARRALRGLIISALLSALVYSVLAAIGDVRTVSAALTSFPASAGAVMVVLTLACYALRSIRWRYLTGIAGSRASLPDAVFTQLAGMTMTVTPGKIGEVLKALIARETSGLPVPRGVALVFSERLADVVAVTALSTGAVGLFARSGPALTVAALVLVVGIALLSSARVHRLALSLALRQRWMKQHSESAAAVSETVRGTLALKPLAVSVVLSASAWSCEGLAFAACIRAFGFDGITAPAAVAVYAISTLVGAFTFLPGGIGLTEASIVGLLAATGMQPGVASAATLLIRLVTLWFGVALGWAVFATRPGVLRKLLRGDPRRDDAGESPAS